MLWLDNIRLNPMSRLTWKVKIKHITRSLNSFSLALPLLEMLRKFPSPKRNQLGEKSETHSLSGPHFSPRTTWPETNGSGEILKHRNEANIYPRFTKRSTKSNVNFHCSRIFKLWHYCIIIDLCRARFKRRILHAPNIIKFESTRINKFGWFNLKVAFFGPNEIVEHERRVHIQAPIQHFHQCG